MLKNPRPCSTLHIAFHLIVYGTRFGATANTSEEIAKIFRQQVLETDVADAKKQKIKEIDSYSLVVVGSGIQVNRWTGEP